MSFSFAKRISVTTLMVNKQTIEYVLEGGECLFANVFAKTYHETWCVFCSPYVVVWCLTINSIKNVCKSFKLANEPPKASFKSEKSFKAFADRMIGAMIPSKKFGSLQLKYRIV